jgi:peptidyl-prolyl cis-trans isomerase C/peptidyl-prolyl cis-trans isomerase D
MIMRLFVSLLLLVAPRAFAAPNDVIASVGNKQITEKDFNERYDEVVRQAINPPSKELFLEDLIRYEVGVQEAQKRDLQNDPIVKERIRQEMYKGLVEKELGEKIKNIKVNEAEMKAYYVKNPELRTSHILIEFKPEATAEQRKVAQARAQEIYSEVKKSKRPFEELVALYTDDVLSKKTGGDVGWQNGSTLVPNYYNAALGMKVGDVKGLVETQYGFHIIKLTGRRSYADANKRQIRTAVFDEKRKDIFNAYFNQLKKRYVIKIVKSESH